MKELIEFLTENGPTLAYVILFLGSLVEGESVVLSAGFLAYTGFLRLDYVMMIAFSATMIADQSLYYVGRFYGPSLLARHPKWQDRTAKIFRLLNKHSIGFILVFRFIYGIRTLSPLVIGTSGIPIRRFTVLNLIAAIIWTILSCSGGYFLGYLFADDIDVMLEKAMHYQKIIVLTLVCGVLGVAGFLYWRRLRAEKKHNTQKGD